MVKPIFSTLPDGQARIFYVSYDGIEEPLGRSQVLAYLRRLAPHYLITLISFEKSGPGDALQREMAGLGIDWRPLRYHRHPAVISTLFDVLAGRRALIRAAREGSATIVHVRSYVPALIALLARGRTGGRFLFDIRGFWADERVEGGLWRPGGFLYKLAKWCERRFFKQADGIVTLTESSVTQIQALANSRAPIEVIPTCVDLERFRARERPSGPHAVWCGSIGTWYRFDLSARIAHALSLPLTVITRQVDLARKILGEYPAAVRSLPPDGVPDALFERDVGLCLIAASWSKLASAPTRFAECLAAGMPVVVTAGVGDLDGLVERHRVGVVLKGEDDQAVATAAEAMLALLAEPNVCDRCRRLARQRFDVELGAAQYAAMYRRLVRPA